MIVNEIPRVSFHRGNALDLDWSDFNVIYLYNPFAEHTDWRIGIDDTIALSPSHFETYVKATEKKLAALKSGTKVITYNGFGGEIPDCFEMKAQKMFAITSLEVWVRH